MRKAISKDGTSIAYDQSGKGPAVILVCGGSVDHTSNAPLAALLAEHFTVFNYHRRGRGAGTRRRMRSSARSRILTPSSPRPADRHACMARPPVRASPSRRPQAGSPSQSWRSGSRRSCSMRVADRRQTRWSVTTSS